MAPDFHQPVAQLCYREPVLAGSCFQTTRSSQGPKLISWYSRQSTTEPFHTMWNSSYAKFFQFGTRSNFLQANSMQHTATTKHHSSDNIEPCNQHSTFVISLFCHTRPALGLPRLPTIERAALQPRATSCPVHGQHSEHLPFCEAPVEISSRAPWSHSRPLVPLLLRSSCNRISTALDDAVACSIRTDNPVSKWNSDHNAFTSVTGAQLEPNILDADSAH